MTKAFRSTFIFTMALFLLSGILTACERETPIERGRIPASSWLSHSENQGEERNGVSDKEVILGSCSALDGKAAFLGTQTIVGAKTYINYVNSRGGVAGRQIKLITHSDSYDPDKAVDCFNQLLKENIFAAAFFVGTPTAAKYLPLADAKGVPLVGLFTGAQLLHEPFRKRVISVRASYYDEAREQIYRLWNDLGVRRISVIYQNDAFGAAVLMGVRKMLELYGSTPVSLASFARNTLEVDDAVFTTRDANPQAVILVGTYGSLAEIVKRCHDLNFHPLFTTVSFVGTEAFVKAAGKDAEGVLITQVVPAYDRTDLPSVTLYKQLLQKSSPKNQPNFVSLEGFIDAMVVVEGLKRAGRDLTRAKFIRALESIHDLDVGLGPELKLNYSTSRHKGFDSVYFTLIRQGRPTTFTDWANLKKQLAGQ
jgi:ABC-type branched-subunit amino acid transport system substrate-binding protein